MWIEELYIDEFGGADDLALRPLSAGMNVIQVSAESAALRLLDFVPGLLYGPPDWPQRASGSAIVHASLTHDRGSAEQTIELCRLTLDERGSLSELQVLSAEGEQTIESDELPFAAVGLDGFLALFTNRLAPTERVAAWQNSAWLAPLWRKRRRVESARRDNSVSAVDAPAVVQPTRPAETQWAAAYRRWQTWEAERSTRNADNAKTISPTTDLELVEIRRQYLAARGQVRRQTDRLRQVRTAIESLEKQLASLVFAQNWHARWQELETCKSSADAATANIDATDLAELERLDQELRDLRAELERLRIASESSLAADVPAASSRSVVDRRRQEIERLLDDYPACRQQWLNVCGERTRIEQRQREQRRPEKQVAAWPQRLTLAEAEAAIGRVVAADRELQCCRKISSRWPREWLRAGDGANRSGATNDATVSTAAELLGHTASTGAAATIELDKGTAAAAATRRTTDAVADTTPVLETDAADDAAKLLDEAGGELTRAERIASLQRQIRQLREESRRLLDRQLLSRQSLVAIGLLFSGGAAVLMSSLVLDLGGEERAASAIGVTCMLSALLLKLSFERAPSYKLREHRERVTELIEELRQLGVTPEGMLDDTEFELAAATQAAATPPQTSLDGSAEGVIDETPAEELERGERQIVPLRATPSAHSADAAGAVPTRMPTAPNLANLPGVPTKPLALATISLDADENFEDPIRRPDANTITRLRGQLTAAEATWRQLMSELQLPSVCSPGDAIAQLRRRIGKSTVVNELADEIETPAASSRLTSGSEQGAVVTMYDRSVRPWCLAAAQVLSREAEVTGRTGTSDLTAESSRRSKRRMDTDACQDPAIWQSRLADELRDLLQQETAASHALQVQAEREQKETKREHTRLQQAIRSLKQTRGELLARTGAADLAELRSHWERRQRNKQQRQRQQRLMQELTAALNEFAADSPHLSTQQIQMWWEQAADLTALERDTRDQLKTNAEEAVELQRQLRAAEVELARLSSWRPVRATHEGVDIQSDVSKRPATPLNAAAWQWLGAILQKLAKPSTATPLTTTPASPPAAAESSPAEGKVGVAESAEVRSRAAFLTQADDYLRRLTGIEFCTIHWESLDAPILIDLPSNTVPSVTAASNESLVDQAATTRCELHELAAPLRDEVIMALQLALVRAASRGYGALPMIWSDHEFVGSNRDVRQAKRLMKQAAGGIQVLLVTTRDAVAELFHELGVPTLWIGSTTLEESAVGNDATYDRDAQWELPTWQFEQVGRDSTVDVPWDRS
ncbi:MAG: hypothetical protein KDB23_18980 [Planctomycetales bacterium]|nr:hypothetical protein [Planctomycetales bacterium]